MKIYKINYIKKSKELKLIIFVNLKFNKNYYQRNN